jgi:hypothetical protein
MFSVFPRKLRAGKVVFYYQYYEVQGVQKSLLLLEKPTENKSTTTRQSRAVCCSYKVFVFGFNTFMTAAG